MSAAPDDRLLRIGELARRTGLTVRTLHHYDAVGLLVPSTRTDAGHRRYTAADVARLQQIASLRALGLPLDAIREALDGGVEPRAVLERHLAHLRAQIALQRRLATRLEGLAAHLDHTGGAAVEDLLQLIHLTTTMEKHYTPEQLEYLEKRRAEVGEERIQAVQREWQDLFAAVRAHMEAGTDPAEPEVQALARKAEALIGEFTGGDAGIRRSLDNAVRADTKAMYTAWGIEPELGDYYGRAMAALHASE
ncbi:MAG TPA: MerR family transcriptional regulator [Rubricoccaceae bacterium]|nr:MerR family transcriptional regulator [Rubricoccaceae bacterium]